MNADTLAKIRLFGFGCAGIICAVYSVAALATNTSNPMSPWLPGVSGFAAGALIWISAFAAGRRVAGIAHDELYQIEWSKAVRFSYWFAILLYPLFGVMLANGWIAQGTAFASMGTATGAAPMLAFCIITLRT